MALTIDSFSQAALSAADPWSHTTHTVSAGRLARGAKRTADRLRGNAHQIRQRCAPLREIVTDVNDLAKQGEAQQRQRTSHPTRSSAMTYEEAQRECQRLTHEQGNDRRTVSQYRVVCTTNNPANLASGWAIIARPFGDHFNKRTVAH